MGDIDIISTSCVQIAAEAASITNNNGVSRLDLTPWDLQLLPLDPIQKGILFHKPQSQTQQQELELIDHLKNSLSRALRFFSPLAGRLAVAKNEDDNTSSFYIDCNNAGALFSHAKAHGVHVNDILEPLHVPVIVRSFFSLNGVLNYEGVSNPLLGVQVTELEDGLFIACTINHCVMDGTSFWHFFNFWSEISRGGTGEITKFPVFDRSFIKKFTENPIISVPHFDFQPKSNKDQILQPQLLERVFHIGKENIAKLKAKANSEAGTNKISSLQALIAHLWRSVMRCRNVDSDQEVSCMFLAGTRTRLSLPDTYFGNAISLVSMTTDNGTLLRNGLGWVALELNKRVALQTREEIERVVKDSATNPKIITKSELMKTNRFAISSTPRHNVYGTDFGWGRPVAVRSGVAQKFDGKITVFPTAEAGGIDVEACLAPETLIALGDDAEFMEAVTI